MRPGMRGGKKDGPSRWLSCPRPLLGGFDPVVYAITDEVDKRVTELVQDRLIQLGLRSFRDEVNFLTQFRGEVVNQALESAEGRADRHHPNAQNVVAQLGH